MKELILLLLVVAFLVTFSKQKHLRRRQPPCQALVVVWNHLNTTPLQRA